MRNVLKSLCVTVGLIGLSATYVHAEQFDTSFSGDGQYTVSFASKDRAAIAMLELPDGGHVLISTCPAVAGNSNACLAKSTLNANGGLVVSSEGGFNGIETITGAAVDSRGRYVVIGTSVPGVNGLRNFRAIRFFPDGNNDASFGSIDGVEVDFFGLDDYATAVAIDANDNVVIVGQAGSGTTDTEFGIARFRAADGALDTSFGNAGKTAIAFDLGPTQKIDLPKAVAIAASGGRISIAGIAYDSAISRFRVALVRINSNGALDTTFCPTSCTLQGSYTAINNGRRVYYFGANTAHTDTPFGIALAGNGDFFIVGETYAADGSAKRAAIARFSSSGDYAAEALNDGLGNNAAYRSVQVSDANAQRVLVAGDSGPNGNYLLLQAFSSGLSPLAGYGDCLNNTAFCFIGGAGIGDNGPDQAGMLGLDRSGRPIYAGTFVASSGDYRKSLFARFTNNTGPKPDRIFRNGF